MGQVAYATGLVAEGDIRVVIFPVGDPGRSMYEGRCLIIILKAEVPDELAISNGPSLDLGKQAGCALGR